MSERMCEGRVCVVTGAGAGLGREYALSLARHGAAVVVNDLGVSLDGQGGSVSPAEQVVAEIHAEGGEAVANFDDVADFAGAARLVEAAVQAFGGLHVVVNNAGILRDSMLVNMEESAWDAVVGVHLKGTFAMTRHAAAYWRDRSRVGESVDGRVINTTSVSGLYGNVGQANYAAAKMGIAGFTTVAAMELGRYGVTVNAIAPGAVTRMNKDLPGFKQEDPAKAAKLAAKLGPQWVAPVCTWLASPLSHGVTGRVIEASGRVLAIAEGWHRGPTAAPVDDPYAVGELILGLLTKARPNADLEGRDGAT